ncbi:hypothetical protein [Streptomyces sp. URMC 123]|uniref:hypothetical protein n=1 Tax=Streptomyces sp. URMC 123 TaxID=3423403 RepID=UPI003F1ACFCD
MRPHLSSTARRAMALGAAALALATGAALAATGPAVAAPVTTPGFLDAQDLPPHAHSAWYAGPVTTGLPEHPQFCAEGVLPETGAAHREFRTDLETGATQIVIRAGGESAAARLAAAIEKSVRGCAARYEQENPGGSASWRDYGTLPVEEGAHVHGVHTTYPDSERNIHLFGVGRDGSTVTLVTWAQYGDFTGAPVTAFRATTRTAVDKLH